MWSYHRWAPFLIRSPPPPLSPSPTPLSLSVSICTTPLPPSPLSLSLSLCSCMGQGGGGGGWWIEVGVHLFSSMWEQFRGSEEEEKGQTTDMYGHHRTGRSVAHIPAWINSLCLSVCLSVCLPVCLSVCLSRYCPPPIHLYLILHPSSLPSLCPYYFLLALSVSCFLYLFPVLPRGLLSFPLSLSETTALWMLRFFACLKPQQRPTSVNGFTQWNKAEINGISTLSNLAPELSLHATWHTTCCTW